MTATTHPSPPPPTASPEKALTLALRLAHAENALHALTLGQVDAIVDRFATPRDRVRLKQNSDSNL